MKSKKKIGPSEAARILGRLGGMKGGAARALALTPERRREIARNAVLARWAKAQSRPKKSEESAS